MKKIIVTFIAVMLFFTITCCTNQKTTSKTYTISFESDSDQSFDKVTITGQQTIALPVPQKEGFIFQGWYPNNRFQEGTEVTNNTMIGKTITLYAKWEPIDITITFNLDGGSFIKDGQMTQQIKAGQSPTLYRATKDGYLFIGYKYNDQLVEENTTFTKDSTLEAMYLSRELLDNNYHITFNLNGGSFYQLNEEAYDVIYDVSDQFLRSLSTFTKHNRWEYYYNCFNLLQNQLIGFDAYFGDDDNYNNWRWLMMYLATCANEDASQYLYTLATHNYEQLANTYTIEQYAIINEIDGFINTDKASNEKNGITYISYDYSLLYDNNTLALFLEMSSYDIGENTLLPIPIRDGYEFMGWYDNEALNGNAIFMIKYNEYGDKTLYAKWQKQ